MHGNRTQNHGQAKRTQFITFLTIWPDGGLPGNTAPKAFQHSEFSIYLNIAVVTFSSVIFNLISPRLKRYEFANTQLLTSLLFS